MNERVYRYTCQLSCGCSIAFTSRTALSLQQFYESFPKLEGCCNICRQEGAVVDWRSLVAEVVYPGRQT